MNGHQTNKQTMTQSELEGSSWMGIEGQKFQLEMKRDNYSGSVIEGGGLTLQVLSDPVQERRKLVSKWKIVNWLRRVTGREYENVWTYTVKIGIDNKHTQYETPLDNQSTDSSRNIVTTHSYQSME